jgi:transketolase C-terminal domain/subunit
MVKNSMDAVKIFPNFSIFAMDKIKPIDESIIGIIKNYKDIVVIEDNFNSGLYNSLCQFVVEKNINVRNLISISVNESFGSKTGDTKYLDNIFGLTSEKISSLIQNLNDNA